MAGTIYATKEELTEAIVKLVYPNTTKSVTALGNQTAILDVVETLWAQLGSGGTGGTGDLQAVLDLGSLAFIPADFDLTANNTQLLLSNGTLSSSSYVNGTIYQTLTSNPDGIEHNSTGSSNGTARLKVGGSLVVFDSTFGSSFSRYTQDPSGFTINSEDTSLDGGILVCGANGFRTAVQDTGNAISIVGDPESDSGYKVSREYNPTNDASALWDIAGDLRIREVDELVNDTYPLTVDFSGNVHKGVPLKLTSYFSGSSSTLINRDDGGDGGRRCTASLSSNPVSITIPLNLMLVGQEQTIYQLGTGGITINGPDVTIVGSATTSNPGDKITIFRVPDNIDSSFPGEVYVIS
jgi:hypothetical protein